MLYSFSIYQTDFFYYDHLVLVSPSLNLDIYHFIIIGFGAGLTRRYVRKLIEVQDRISNVESAINLVGRLLSH